MKEILIKWIVIVFLIAWGTLGFHLIIVHYNDGNYWACSFEMLANYLLLRFIYDVIMMKVDKGGEK